MCFVLCFSLCTPAQCARENPRRGIADTAQLGGPGDPRGCLMAPELVAEGLGAYFLWRRKGRRRSCKSLTLPRKQAGGGGERTAIGVRIQFPASGKTLLIIRVKLKRLSSWCWQRRAARSWEARLLITHNQHCFSHVGEWGRGKDPGVARCSQAPVVPQNEWIPQPLAHLPEALSLGCTTREAGIRRKCGVTFPTVPADASAPTPATRGDRESGCLLPTWVVMWV